MSTKTEVSEKVMQQLLKTNEQWLKTMQESYRQLKLEEIARYVYDA